MDKLSKLARSENMRRIKSQGMKPEMVVRSLAHRLGYRFRLHRRDLPGKPDLVFRGRKKVIFVHGCFWHGHNACGEGRVPISNTDYWGPKLQRNKERDTEQQLALAAMGWQYLVIWECQTTDANSLEPVLRQFLERQ